MPVQQHPIPQNVTAYQFRLVGDMTLQQFLQLAAGVIIAIIIYATPLPVFFKWPLIALFVGIGAALAFLPVEGRPLDQWILAFIRSIYAPTIYTWQKPKITPTPIVTTSFNKPETPISNFTPLTTVSPNSSTFSGNRVPEVGYQKPEDTSPVLTSTNQAHKSARSVTPLPQTPFAVDKQNLNKPEANLKPNPSSQYNALATNTNTQQPGQTAVFSTNLPIPSTPSTKNTIVGMTLTKESKIQEDAIVEILEKGQTIRATKSNKLGQFLFAKPLPNGDYQITADYQGNKYPIFDLKLKDQIVPPIKLQAKS